MLNNRAKWQYQICLCVILKISQSVLKRRKPLSKRRGVLGIGIYSTTNFLTIFSLVVNTSIKYKP